MVEPRSGAGSIPASCSISQTVEAATFTPSTSSSPCTRRYPQPGFSRTSRNTRTRIERTARGRPRRRGRDRQACPRATRSRCQRSTVSGRTTKCSPSSTSLGSRCSSAASNARSPGVNRALSGPSCRCNTGQWVWSERIAQEPLVSVEDFEAAQVIIAGAGAARQASHETRHRVRNPYALRGRLYCGFCERRMQGQYNHGVAYYRCRYPKEYALAAHVRHPSNVYLREPDVVPAIDRWLSAIFAPHRLDQTIREIEAAQPPAATTTQPDVPAPDSGAVIADCDAKLARYQAALDAGADPQAIARWTRQVEADRATALAREATAARHQPGRRLTTSDIRALITSLGDLRDVIRDATLAEKIAIYDQLGLKITYKPGQAKIRAEVTIGPETYVEHAEQCGDTGRVRGASRLLRTCQPLAVKWSSADKDNRDRLDVDAAGGAGFSAMTTDDS